MTTIEIVQFRLKADVQEADYLTANEAVQADLQQASGYISREMAKGEDGEWLDILHWNSLAEAQRAAEAFPTWPSAQKMAGLIDGDSIKMMHLQQVAKFDPVPTR
jgi:hypothetical protein